MIFRAEFSPKLFSVKIKHTDKLLLVGSCFTEQIGKKLAAHKFCATENPNGILFNPMSIAKAITSYTESKIYTADELFYYNELWASKDHHTRFSDPDQHKALQNINDAQQHAAAFIREADWLILTLGSAFLYEWKDTAAGENYNNVAANCHKIPTDKFNRRLANSEEIAAVLQTMTDRVRLLNPAIKIMYTISPVRHLREGFIENNRSKASLIQAVHSLTDDKTVFYFPAYELIIDDLRDYRFFAEDLVHPNYAATDYVWGKFIPAVTDDATQQVLKEINEINAAVNHKPFNPTSEAHKDFRKKYAEKVNDLKQLYPHINFDQELSYFSV